ncbi:hypothetical protein [Paracoccus marinus]|uniref:hypothetical protein n=1 Tax=Paracoccus marinus TaxID=288426 RepID=UPI0010394506|nr:hypothetical protein [Paracoccus marinus]GLS81601.1 hypothetical protein GCM10007893_24170 [Paracoccus marinus]
MTCTRNDWRDRGRVALIVLALTLAAKLSVPGAAWAQAGDEPGWALDDLAVLYQPFPYEAKDVALTDMLQQMTIKTGVPVIAAQGLAGRVSVANGSGSLRDALDQVSGDAGLLWWFDGAAVHVEPASAMTSRLLPLQGVSMPALREQLDAVGMAHTSYRMIANDRASVVRVVAPRGYTDALAEVIAAMAAERSARADGGRSGMPLIIRGPARQRRPANLGYGAQPGAGYQPSGYPAGAYSNTNAAPVDAGRGYPANGYYGAGYPAGNFGAGSFGAGNFGAGNFGAGNFGAAPAPATSGATAPGYFAPATAPAAGRASQ